MFYTNKKIQSIYVHKIIKKNKILKTQYLFDFKLYEHNRYFTVVLLIHEYQKI